MKKRGWSSTAWVLTALVAVILLIGVDIVRRAVVGAPKPQQGPQAPAGKDSWLKLGAEAKDFELPDLDGRPHKLSDFRGRKVVLTFFCGCERCGAFATELVRVYKKAKPKPPAVTLSVMTAGWEPTATPSFIARTGAKWTYLFSIQRPEVVELYQGHPCPKAYVIDEKGKITYISPPPDLPMSRTAAIAAISQSLGLPFTPPRGAFSPRLKATK